MRNPHSARTNSLKGFISYAKLGTNLVYMYRGTESELNLLTVARKVMLLQIFKAPNNIILSSTDAREH